MQHFVLSNIISQIYSFQRESLLHYVEIDKTIKQY